MVTSIRVTSSYFSFVIFFFLFFFFFVVSFFYIFFYFFFLFYFPHFKTDGSSDRAASTTVSRGQLVDDVAIEFQILRNLLPLSVRSRSIFLFSFSFFLKNLLRSLSLDATKGNNQRNVTRVTQRTIIVRDPILKIPKRDPHSRSLYTRITFLYGSLL